MICVEWRFLKLCRIHSNEKRIEGCMLDGGDATPRYVDGWDVCYGLGFKLTDGPIGLSEGVKAFPTSAATTLVSGFSSTFRGT